MMIARGVRNGLRGTSLFLRGMIKVELELTQTRVDNGWELRSACADGRYYAERDVAVCMRLACGGRLGERSPLRLLPPEIVVDKILRENMATPPARFMARVY